MIDSSNSTMRGPVLIFGGVGGIGEALARRLAGGGRPVIVTSRSLERAAALADEIGGRAVVCDVLEDGAIASAVEQSVEDGALSGVAYCVGSIDLKPLSKVSASDMAACYALNTIGAMQAVQASAHALRAGGGSAVLFSTVAARQGFSNHTIIASAKAGLEGLTLSLAAELAPHVRVNCIAPSLSNTSIAAPLTKSEQMADAIAKMHPLPRLGEPADSAAMAAFLLSPDSGWMTGQIIGVDGGRSTLRTKG